MAPVLGVFDDLVKRADGPACELADSTTKVGAPALRARCERRVPRTAMLGSLIRNGK
jgi:hypothetical protein